MELVLASSSPRRQELLRAAGIGFEVRPSNVPEELLRGEAPAEFSERLAREKGSAVWKAIANDPRKIVLAADTIVVVDEHILGKPVNVGDAARMLRLLSARSHEVITSVCLLGKGVSEVRSERTTVFVSSISEREIADYIASGEPMDKAGAYGIQGLFSRWIPRVEGDYTNVVGLPIALVYRMLLAHGAL